MEQQIIGVSELAKQLGVSRELIHREIRLGRLHATKISERFYGISKSDLDAYLANRKERGL